MPSHGPVVIVWEQQYESVCGLTTHMFGFWCCSAWLWAMNSPFRSSLPIRFFRKCILHVWSVCVCLGHEWVCVLGLRYCYNFIDICYIFFLRFILGIFAFILIGQCSTNSGRPERNGPTCHSIFILNLLKVLVVCFRHL